MKKIITVALTILVCMFSLSSCVVRINEDVIKGDILEEIDKIDVKEEINKDEYKNVEGTGKELDENKEQATVPTEKTPDALSFIQSLGAVVREEENDSDKIAVEFLTSLQNKDVEKIASLCGGKSEYYDFVTGTDIAEYVMVPFEIPEEVSEDKNEQGYYTTSNYLYAVSLKISSASEQESNPFSKGDSLWCLFIDTDAFLGYNVLGFVPYDLAEKKIFGTFENEFVEHLIHMISVSRVFEGLEIGRNDACDFDFKDDIHFVTHLTAWIKDEYPPFSINEMNGVLSKVLDGNKGVEIEQVFFWSSIWRNQPNVSFSTEELYTDFDIKAFGCAYAHGGTTLEYLIKNDEKNGTERTVTVEYYSDFANLSISKVCVFHFDQSGEFPNLLGIELTYDSGNLTCGVAV